MFVAFVLCFYYCFVLLTMFCVVFAMFYDVLCYVLGCFRVFGGVLGVFRGDRGYFTGIFRSGRAGPTPHSPELTFLDPIPPTSRLGPPRDPVITHIFQFFGGVSVSTFTGHLTPTRCFISTTVVVVHYRVKVEVPLSLHLVPQYE